MVHNLTLNGMSFLEFDKESKATKQATRPEVAGEEDILFQLASDDDVSDDYEMTCTMRTTQIMRSLLQLKMILAFDLLHYGMTTT